MTPTSAAAAARPGGRRRRVRRRRHLRRRARAAGHDGQRRHPDRPAPAGRADRLRLPARVRRDAAADRPDRRPARPGAGAGRGAGRLRRRLAGHHARLRHAHAWWPAGSSRASAAAAWCRRRWPWSPTSTPPSAAASRSASSPRSRSSAACSARSSAPSCWRVADWRAIFLVNLAVGAGPRGRDPARSAGDRPRRRRRAPGGGSRTWSGCACCCSSRWSPARWSSSGRRRCCATSPGARLFIPFAGDGRWLTPLGVVAIGARAAVRGPLLHRRAGRWSTCAAGSRTLREADLVGALLLAVALAGVILAFATADPRGPGLLRPGPAGTSSAPRSRRSRSPCTCAAPRRRWCRPARCGVRRPGARMLVSFFVGRRADRGADRHPDLRPDHRLPRLAADGRAGAGPVPGGAAGRRGARRLPHRTAAAPASSPPSGMALRRSASC